MRIRSDVTYASILQKISENVLSVTTGFAKVVFLIITELTDPVRIRKSINPEKLYIMRFTLVNK